VGQKKRSPFQREEKSMDELKHRLEAKKKELEAQIETAKADAAGQAREKRKRLQEKLDQMEEFIKTGVENLTEEARRKLIRLLK
jgi:hypothetical protein